MVGPPKSSEECEPQGSASSRSISPVPATLTIGGENQVMYVIGKMWIKALKWRRKRDKRMISRLEKYFDKE